MRICRPFGENYSMDSLNKIYFVADTFSELNTEYPPVDYDGRIAFVKTTTGAWNPLVTTRNSGWYRSNGTEWIATTSDIDVELFVNDKIYTQTESCLGSDGHIYRSLIDGNQGHNPVSTTGYWEKITRTESEVEDISIPLIMALGG